MKNTQKFRKVTTFVIASIICVIPFRSFAEINSNFINSYLYAGCIPGTEIDINNILTQIKDNICNIQGIIPPQTDSDNIGSGDDSSNTENPDIDNDNNANTSISEYEKKVVEIVNQERIKAGLSPLKLNNELSNVARIKSQDMKSNGYFSHTSPTYGSPFDMLKQFGISYRTAGENIARGQRTPEAVVAGWMNSDGHRANILNDSFTEIGVGYVADGNFWTQLFIG